jgi:hypothetical protein
MDPARWPAGLRKFIDQVGSQANGELVVTVEYTEPVWTITLGCPCCGLARLWNLAGEAPLPDPGSTAIPEAFREVFS